MDLVKKIKEQGYRLREDEQIPHTRLNFLYIIAPDNTERVLAFSDRSLISIGQDVKNMEEAKEKAAQNIGVLTDCLSVYKDYYNLSGEEWEYRKVNYSRRAVRAIMREKTRLGFIRYVDEESSKYIECDPDTLVEYDSTLTHHFYSSKVHIGQASDGTWLAQYGFQYDIDGFRNIYYYYSKKPSEKDFEDTVLLLDIESRLRFGEIQEDFLCLKCGKQYFWLDCGETIYECADCAEEKYCGC